MSQPKPPNSPPPVHLANRLAVPSAVPLSPEPPQFNFPPPPPKSPGVALAVAPPPPPVNLPGTPQPPSRQLGGGSAGISSSSSSFSLFSLRNSNKQPPRALSIGATHRALINEAIREHSLDEPKESSFGRLLHVPEPVQRQAQKALNNIRQLSTFIRKVAESQLQFSVKLKELTNRQWDSMVLPETRDGMNSTFEACRGYVDRVIQQAEMNERVSKVLTEECCPALDQFVSLHAESCKSWVDHLGNLKVALEKTQEGIVPARKRAAQAIRALYEAKQTLDQLRAKQRQGEKVSKTVLRQKESEVEKCRKKAHKATQTLEALIEAGAQQYLDYELRKQKYLQLIQTLEEQRAKVMHSVLSQSVDIMDVSIDSLRVSWRGLMADAEQISAHADISTFVQQVLRVHPAPEHVGPWRGQPQLPKQLTTQLTVRSAELDKDWYYSEDNSLFGNTLEGSMVYQRRRYPEIAASLTIPHILIALSDAVELRDGFRTQGIFRISAKSEELQQLRFQLELGDYSMTLPGDADAAAAAAAAGAAGVGSGDGTGSAAANGVSLQLGQGPGEVDPTGSPHIPAALLKLWLRELRTPLIPYQLYSRCIQSGKDSRNLLDNAERAGGGEVASTANTPTAASVAAPAGNDDSVLSGAADNIRSQLRQIIESLPQLNRDVLRFLLHFLRRVAHPDNVVETKMGRANLAIVFAPCSLRLQYPDPEQEMLDSNYATECMERLIEWQDELFAGLTSSNIVLRSPSGGLAPTAEPSEQADLAAGGPRSPTSSSASGAESVGRLAALSDDDEEDEDALDDDDDDDDEEQEEQEEGEELSLHSPSSAAADVSYPEPPPLPEMEPIKTREELLAEAEARAVAEALEAEEKQREQVRLAEEQRKAAEEAELLRLEQEERECPAEPPQDLAAKWKAIAQWDFEPDEDDDGHERLCEFMSQDVLHVCFTSKWGKWVYVHNQRTDRRGYAPKVFLLKIKDL